MRWITEKDKNKGIFPCKGPVDLSIKLLVVVSCCAKPSNQKNLEKTVRVCSDHGDTEILMT